jgi:hypothetical protein
MKSSAMMIPQAVRQQDQGTRAGVSDYASERVHLD